MYISPEKLDDLVGSQFAGSAADRVWYKGRVRGAKCVGGWLRLELFGQMQQDDTDVWRCVPSTAGGISVRYVKLGEDTASFISRKTGELLLELRPSRQGVPQLV